jgi:hypothetical protein
VPSEFGCGVKSGSEPDEQHTGSLGTNVEHRVELGLYCVNSAAVMLHSAARLAHVSPSLTRIYEQVCPIAGVIKQL